MSDLSASTTIDPVSREEPRQRGEIAAKYLVTFVFLINVCFTVYMITQFFTPKTYGNGLHAIYTTVVFATVLLLGLSTRSLWTGNTRRGVYAFFGAIAVSFIGNLVSQSIKQPAPINPMKFAVAKVALGSTADDADVAMGMPPVSVTKSDGYLISPVTMLAAENELAPKDQIESYSLREYQENGSYAVVAIGSDGRVAGRWAGSVD
jgi:ABC-type transport system involved in multi-copper enzyme maturation permease subunit